MNRVSCSAACYGICALLLGVAMAVWVLRAVGMLVPLWIDGLVLVAAVVCYGLGYRWEDGRP